MSLKHFLKLEADKERHKIPYLQERLVDVKYDQNRKYYIKFIPKWYDAVDSEWGIVCTERDADKIYTMILDCSIFDETFVKYTDKRYYKLPALMVACNSEISDYIMNVELAVIRGFTVHEQDICSTVNPGLTIIRSNFKKFGYRLEDYDRPTFSRFKRRYPEVYDYRQEVAAGNPTF